MIYKTTKDRIQKLIDTYKKLAAQNHRALHEIALAEIPEMVYNSNAIENSTLSLKDTEDIILRDIIKKDHDVREIYEAKNLAKITSELQQNPETRLSVELILALHRILLSNINDWWAGRFRIDGEWVRIGTHVGANPEFVPILVRELIDKYNTDKETYFLDKIAWFHAEFETVHPFPDGNGRMGRVIINQQLMKLGLPPIIIRNKNKHTKYYPLFVEYQTNEKYDNFTELFALLLMESLHKRITLLTAKRLITLNKWAKENGISVSAANNKARRQTIPAFRMSEEWMIAADYSNNQGEK